MYNAAETLRKVILLPWPSYKMKNFIFHEIFDMELNVYDILNLIAEPQAPEFKW